MDNLGRRLIKAIIATEDLSGLKRHQIDRDDLLEEARAALDFVTNFVFEQGEYPSVAVVEENIRVPLPSDTDAFDYIADKVRKRSLAGKLEKTLEATITKIDQRDPDAALDHLVGSALELKSHSVAGSVTSYNTSGESRAESYSAAKALGGVVGMPTMWPTINHSIQGWVDGCLHVIAGMTGTGKTWVSCISANHAAHVLGKRVLLVTMEMSAPRITRRIDALHHKIPFGVLRDAEMDTFTEERWKSNILQAPADAHPDILVADKKIVRTVPDISALVYEHHPELVIIDGGYRLEAHGSSNNWDKTVKVVGGLQDAAEMSILPWVVTTQLGDSNETGAAKTSDNHVRGWNVRYGKEWTIDPDVLLGLYQDDDLRLVKRMELHTLKMRDADKIKPKCYIEWDMDTMSFDECAGEEHTSSYDEDDEISF